MYFDVFGSKSLAVAKDLSADGVKIHTTDFYNTKLIDKAIQSFEKVFISIGGIPVLDIDSLMNDVLKGQENKICLLYGFQSEPTPIEYNNLFKFSTFKEKYPDFQFGFMDHADGESEEAIYLSLLTMGMGVTVIEKHLTLDRSLKIEDYVSGLPPENFRKFVNIIRACEPALGIASLELTELENQYGKKAIKIVVAIRDLQKGHIIQISDIMLKRSSYDGQGEPIKQLEVVLNKRLKTAVQMNSPIFVEQI